MAALERRAEVEFLKLTVVVNAIITTGDAIRKTIANDGGTDSKALDKSIDLLKQKLCPHWIEADAKKVKDVRKKLAEEAARGPLTIKVVGKDKTRRRR